MVGDKVPDLPLNHRNPAPLSGSPEKVAILTSQPEDNRDPPPATSTSSLPAADLGKDDPLEILKERLKNNFVDILFAGAD
jgi:hypothetical protein